MKVITAATIRPEKKQSHGFRVKLRNQMFGYVLQHWLKKVGFQLVTSKPGI